MSYKESVIKEIEECGFHDLTYYCKGKAGGTPAFSDEEQKEMIQRKHDLELELRCIDSKH